MPAYLITGPNDSGKSTAGKELASRGYVVIETDLQSGLSGWFDNETHERVDNLPDYPYSQEWLDSHSWLWDRQRFQEVIDQNHGKTIFFCGGAYNQKDMYGLFDKHFTLFVDDATAIKRLQARGETNRWNDDSAELKKMLDWNKKSKQHGIDSGGVIINSDRPIAITADDILKYCDPKTEMPIDAKNERYEQ